MAQVNNEQQISIPIAYDEISDAGCVTDECSSAFDTFGLFNSNGMVKIEEGNTEYSRINKCFLLGMGSMAIDTRIAAIHKNQSSTLTGKARFDSFNVFANAVAKKCGGDANVTHAWYGASMDEINDIVCHGFSRCGNGAGKFGQMNGFRFGVQLAHLNSSIDGVLSSELDERGLRHILLCRVILGKMEVIRPGSKQFHPSSEEFDSGVDNLAAPNRYIVWSCYMNSHILLDYIVSFRIESFEANAIRTTSSLRGVQTLMDILSRFLDPCKMTQIVKCYNDFQNRKVMRREFLINLAKVTGGKLLLAVTRLYMKELNLARTSGSSSGRAT